ncbi:hypothetical protein B1H19_18935 [Streptomyces gilvosporeus]|uniref:Uncharacterized protein n=1 Tax=Streptomyces gilvosporeus TaxID=553510 RepID=A0A1V0TSP6_9ACTN|nr:hypothetical protein B1H19_18935 [Streptomyces gilvosporeus]
MQRAVVALLAAELYELHPDAYRSTQSSVAPEAIRDAERLLAALAEAGVIVTTDEAKSTQTR